MPRDESGHIYDRQSVENAFYTHSMADLITGYTLLNLDGRTGSWDTARVRLSNGDMLTLTSLKEAYIFVKGLATARQAFDRGRYVS